MDICSQNYKYTSPPNVEKIREQINNITEALQKISFKASDAAECVRRLSEAMSKLQEEQNTWKA